MKNGQDCLIRAFAACAAMFSLASASTASAQPLRQALPGYSVIGDSTKTDPKSDGPRINAPSANGYSSNGASWRGQSQGSSHSSGASNHVRSRNTAAPGAATLSSLKPGELKRLASDALKFEKEGLAEEKKGNLNAALLKLKQSLSMREFYWGQRDKAIPVLLERIAAVQARQKKYSDAIASAQKALSYYSKIYGPGTSDRIPALILLGKLYQENKDLENSFEQNKQALELTERSSNNSSPEAAKLRLLLARQSNKLGWDKTTDEFFKACIDADQPNLSAAEYANAGEEYAAFLTRLGRADEATIILEKIRQSATESETSSAESVSAESAPATAKRESPAVPSATAKPAK
jgi:hypothetical protein